MAIDDIAASNSESSMLMELSLFLPFSPRVNVGCGPAEERVLLTGLHAVADIYCENCKTTLGWKYVSVLDIHVPVPSLRLVCEESAQFRYRAVTCESETPSTCPGFATHLLWDLGSVTSLAICIWLLHVICKRSMAETVSSSGHARCLAKGPWSWWKSLNTPIGTRILLHLACSLLL